MAVPYTLTITRQSSGSSVILVTGISITGGNTITAKGGTLQLAADITPAEATNKAITWSIVSGSSYATLNFAGLLTAQSNGTVTVRATAQDGSGVYGELQIVISRQGSSGDSGGTGDGRGNTADTKTAISTESQPDYPVTTKISVHATIDKNGHATASIPESAIADAIKQATQTAQSQGKTETELVYRLR